MKLSKMKRVLSATVALMMIGTSLPFTVNAAGSSANNSTLYGDANTDGVVDISDAVLIAQYVKNPDKTYISKQGLVNADVFNVGSGVTIDDANTIKKYLIDLISELPEEPSINVTPQKALLNYDFNSGLSSWTGRGPATVTATDTAYYGTSGKSMYVSGRTAEWNGAAVSLGSDFKAGQTYSISCAALQTSGGSAEIQISLQQGGSNGTTAVYSHIASATCKSGEWTKLENTAFTIPDNAGDMTLYVETVQSTGDLMDFYIDDVVIAPMGTTSSVKTGGTGKVPASSSGDPVDVDPTKWDNYQETASSQYIDFYKSSIKHMGNTYRLNQKLAAAEQGAPLTVAYLGGSITEGKNYTTPFSSYLKNTFAKGSFREINAGLSGTSSVVGLVRSEAQIVSQKPDIIFLEFSVNDHEDIMYKKCFESCIKKFLEMPNAPAVGIIITRAKGGFSSQNQMYPIGKNFDIPVISMDDALTKAFNSRCLNTSDYYTDEYHPHQKGGQLIADCMAYYVRQALKSRNQSSGYTLPSSYVYGAEYSDTVNVDPKNLNNFSAGSWTSGYGYNNSGLNYSYTLNGGNPMKFKTQGKGLIIVFKANSSGMGSINVTVNGKTTKISGNKQYTWGGPDAELGYYQNTSGDLDVSISGSGQFTIWGVGLIK